MITTPSASAWSSASRVFGVTTLSWLVRAVSYTHLCSRQKTSFQRFWATGWTSSAQPHSSWSWFLKASTRLSPCSASVSYTHLHQWSGNKRWVKDEEASHELYNLGHMVDAACAHYQACLLYTSSESNHIGWGEIDFRQKAEQGLSLVDAFRNQLQEEWG